VVFYTILFSCLAVLLVVGGLTVLSRNRRTFAAEKRAEATTAHAHRRQRNAARSQSKKDRRKRR
jgi:type III secretory pathway component EscV